MYNAFSFLQDYMTKHYHFLMFVACEKNMEKTSMYQDKDPSLGNNVLQELRNIMYDKDGPFGTSAKM